MQEEICRQRYQPEPQRHRRRLPAFEAAALAYAGQHVDGAILIMDFAAAFLSLARLFIWLALEAIGLPTQIIKNIQNLYKT